MNECADFGLKSGISFPVHTPTGEFAMLSFTSDKSPGTLTPDMQYALPHLMILTHYIHDAVMRIFRTKQDIKDIVELTQREKQCLLWAAEGKTSDETADILHISESTVRFHLNNAARKLNVHNRRHAIARAICLGLIKPVI
jgi:DNA-binding CsgD family transcriptional regulator